MDLVASCKDKLTYFRIKELKDVLTQLGLSKQGKKQDLVDRILAVISDEGVSKIWAKKSAAVGKEEVAKLVDDTYRKMQVSGATDLASTKGQGTSDGSNIKIKGEVDDSFHSDRKVRCPCGSSLETESMVQCEDPRCRFWQHISCVIIPEKPFEGNPPVPNLFYCEICRLSRADPFLTAIAHPLYPVKLVITSIPADGTSPVQSVEKTFQLTRADRDLLTKQEYDLQAWCMLLNDKVPFRMHWPQYTDLQVNGVPVRAIYRPGSQQLGANGRDDGPIITPCIKDGINKIALTGCDARVFILGVRMVKRRTVQQILSIIPKETDGERFEDALARVCRCTGGGTAANNDDDSDSDIEVVADFFGVNLRCPMSGSRIKVAGRFKPCVHMGGFDLDVFVELNQRSRKWQCPICLKNYSLDDIIIDPYFNRITSKMRSCGEDVTEIDVKPDGSWRARAKTDSERKELGVLAQWHNPDSSLCATVGGEVKPSLEMSKQIKQEGVSEGHAGLKLGIRKNCNGIWEVSKPEDANTSSDSRLRDNFDIHDQKVIPMSSSSTGSGRDGDDASVNQDGVTHEFINNGIELDSISLNADTAYGNQNQSAAAGNAEVIVLSDSDDEIDLLISPPAGYRDNQTEAGAVSFSMASGLPHPYPEEPNPCLGLFNGHDDEFGMPLWTLPSGTQEGAGFQLFNSDADVTDALIDLQHGTIGCPPAMNGSYSLAPETPMVSAALDPSSSIGRDDLEINNGLIDNPLFGGDDPSLQIFLPTQPSAASLQPDSRDQTDVSNGIRSDDWISLTLGGGATGADGDAGAANGLNSRQQQTTPSLGVSLLGSGDGKSDKANRPRSDSPFSFPRQKRSKKASRGAVSVHTWTTPTKHSYL